MLAAAQPMGQRLRRRPLFVHGAIPNLQGEPDRVETSGGIQASLSGRYATALFELARDAKNLAEVEASLARVQATLDESSDFKTLTTSPLISRAEAGKVDNRHLSLQFAYGLGGHRWTLGYAHQSGDTATPYLTCSRRPMHPFNRRRDDRDMTLRQQSI